MQHPVLFLLTLSLNLKVKVNRVNRVASRSLYAPARWMRYGTHLERGFIIMSRDGDSTVAYIVESVVCL